MSEAVSVSVGAAALAVFGVGLLVRYRRFVNRLSQLFLLAMGAWFLWTGIAG